MLMQIAAFRVLVVDDSAEFLAFMQALLTSEGFTVDVAKSVDHARERLGRCLPDMVISDVRLPDTVPFGVLDLLQAEPKTDSLPVLFCTGAVQEVEEAQERLRGPHIDVLFKPFDIDELLSRIHRLHDSHINA